MEGVVAIIVQAIAGAAGGGVAVAMIRSAGMALLPKLVSGAIGGVAGGSILGAIFAGGDVADPGAAAGALDTGARIVEVVGALVGGGVLTGVAGRVLGRR